MLLFQLVIILFELSFCSLLFFFFKQKTAYEMRISDWSSDVCSSDLFSSLRVRELTLVSYRAAGREDCRAFRKLRRSRASTRSSLPSPACRRGISGPQRRVSSGSGIPAPAIKRLGKPETSQCNLTARTEDHTSEHQSLMLISYAVFCMKK